MKLLWQNKFDNFDSSAIGSGLGILTGKFLTGTASMADEAFECYLEKTFTAGMRASAGRSSSALLRQAGKYLAKAVFWDNVTKGVSSVVGSIVVSGPITPVKNQINNLWMK